MVRAFLFGCSVVCLSVAYFVEGGGGGQISGSITKFTSLYFVARIAMEMSVHSQLLFSNKHYRIKFHELVMDIVCKSLPLWHIFFAVVIVFSEKQQQKEPHTLCCGVTLLGKEDMEERKRKEEAEITIDMIYTCTKYYSKIKMRKCHSRTTEERKYYTGKNMNIITAFLL